MAKHISSVHSTSFHYIFFSKYFGKKQWHTVPSEETIPALIFFTFQVSMNEKVGCVSATSLFD